MDMLQKNKVHTELKYNDGFSTYSYPYLQDKSTTKELSKPFVDAITKDLLNVNISEDFPLMNQVLYLSLMGKHKVILGDMPETLYRQQLGNNLSLHELKDLFKFIISKNRELKEPLSLRDATLQFVPHIFQVPRDLYMTALLKESFQAATCIVAMVGIHHFNPVQRYWQPPPHGINYEEATKIPSRIRGDTDENVIEKHAILDVLLEKKAWGAKYISNPFPYLVEDITKVKEEDFKNMKKTFLVNYKKYQEFKNRSFTEIEGKVYTGQTRLINDLRTAHSHVQKDPTGSNSGLNVNLQIASLSTQVLSLFVITLALSFVW
eukprot:TRINITY_DN9140_c0_g3_i1.p1 TRINITY_DN9140_c0_g3~~TRINITY_DN9140_c0_g3_i1.p1  ORF type:complete len:320 (-),score=66.94 TRINITY_DN9140_c0_g3_i1:120-1079(-)